jgi:hypothetical protein
MEIEWCLIGVGILLDTLVDLLKPRGEYCFHISCLFGAPDCS